MAITLMIQPVSAIPRNCEKLPEVSRRWPVFGYDEPEKTDGQRILVDRLWPRGLSKKVLQLDGWLKNIAPSDDLRQWFGHDVDRWDEFRKRYTKELDTSGDAVKQLLDRLGNGSISLIYAAKDKEHNNALLLKDYLQARLGVAG